MIIADSARDAALSDRVARAAEKRFTIVRGSIPTAAATVLVGDALPDEASGLAAPLISVMPYRGGASVRIAALETPAMSPLDTRIPVDAKVLVAGARGRRLSVELVDGDVVVDRRSEVVDSDSALRTVTLAYVPAVAGSTLLRARARIEKTPLADSATTVVDATEDRFEVLFFDPRASWLSTFVRRGVERDPRFAVMHRVVTSRGVSNTGGAAPVALRDAQALSQYATIVIGAPEQLTEADVAGLDAFMRGRGGRVVLLMERRAAGPVDRLMGASGWRAVRLPTPTSLVPIPDSRFPIPGLRVQEIAWPGILPVGASVLSESVGRDATRRAVVWSIPVGAGRLLVSGALDAWHYRDAASGFDDFWTNEIAELAAGAPRLVEVSVSKRSLAPGQETPINVWIRDAALSHRSAPSAAVSAFLIGKDTTMLRLWPGTSPGTFSGMVVAPRESGAYRLLVVSGASRSEVSIVVDRAARAPARDERHLIEAFVSSRSGKVIPESGVDDLPRQLSSALQSVSRVETWHPMRSAWWIFPFALLLGAEWWWRRRRGLA
jgi:hypothetical protein